MFLPKPLEGQVKEEGRKKTGEDIWVTFFQS